MFTIKAAAELTDVPVATLRAWERRYGIALPLRTDSGYRVYDDRALEEIRTMHSLIEEGWAPKQAADEVLRRRRAHVAAFDALAEAHAGLPSPEDVVEAAVALDEQRLSSLLDTAFTRGSFEHVVDAWLTPALHLIGAAWNEGRLDIAGEHMVSGAVMRRLSAVYEASGSASAAPQVLTGLPEHAEHAIPALAFAATARRAGIPTINLGANVPAHAWAQAVRKQSVRAVVLAVSTSADAIAATQAASAIRDAREGLHICIGGATASEVEGATLTFSDGFTESVRQLAQLLASSPVRK